MNGDAIQPMSMGNQVVNGTTDQTKDQAAKAGWGSWTVCKVAGVAVLAGAAIAVGTAGVGAAMGAATMAAQAIGAILATFTYTKMYTVAYSGVVLYTLGCRRRLNNQTSPLLSNQASSPFPRVPAKKAERLENTPEKTEQKNTSTITTLSDKVDCRADCDWTLHDSLIDEEPKPNEENGLSKKQYNMLSEMYIHRLVELKNMQKEGECDVERCMNDLRIERDVMIHGFNKEKANNTVS